MKLIPVDGNPFESGPPSTGYSLKPVAGNPFAAESYDPTTDMSTFDRTAAGVGSGLMDLYLGAKQRLGYATPQDAADKRATDAALLNTRSGMIGNFAGKAIPALATIPIPGLNTLTGAAATGAALGGLEPTTADESVARNVGLGAAGGVVGQGAANMLGRAIAPIRSSLNPEQQRLMQTLLDSGVPLDLAQQTGSKPLAIVNSILEKLPLTGATESAKRTGQSQAFTKAVMAKAGEASDTATPDAMAAAFDRLGGNYNTLYGRNTVNVDRPLMDNIWQAVQKSDQSAPIVAKADKIMANGPQIPGRKYQDIRTQLRTLQGSVDPEASGAARDLKYAMDDAAARSFGPDDAALLAQTRREYGNLNSIAKTMKSPAAMDGQIPYAQFRNVVANADSRGFVQGKGDLNDLARATSLLRDPVPDSGTAQRLLYQSLLTGGLGGLSASGGYLGGGQEGGLLGGGAGVAAALLGPKVAQKMLANKMMNYYLAAGAKRGLLGENISRFLGPAMAGLGAGLLARPQ